MEDLDRGWNKIVEDPKNRKTVEDLERKDGRVKGILEGCKVQVWTTRMV